MPRRFPGEKREIGGVESAKSRQFSKSIDPSGGANRVCRGNGLSPQLSQQPSLHPFFGSFSKGVQRAVEWRSTWLFLGAFRSLSRASQLLLLFASAPARERARNGPKTSFHAPVDKCAAMTKNAPKTRPVSFSWLQEKGPTTLPPGTGKPSRPNTKKAAKPAARRHFSTLQPPYVNFSSTFNPKTSPSRKANVNQCKLFSHFVLNRFCTPESRNYATFSTLRADSQYQTISHFVLCPVCFALIVSNDTTRMTSKSTAKGITAHFQPSLPASGLLPDS